MSVLSILPKCGLMVLCAKPIYLTSPVDLRPGSTVTFEVLEPDASHLRRVLRKLETFGLGAEHAPFMAELTSLERCRSTVAALAFLRDRPAMRGVLTVRGEVDFETKQ